MNRVNNFLFERRSRPSVLLPFCACRGIMPTQSSLSSTLRFCSVSKKQKNGDLLQSLLLGERLRLNSLTKFNMTKERLYSTSSSKVIKVSDVLSNKNEINVSSQFKAVLPPAKYEEENENESIMGSDTKEVSSSSSFTDLPGTVHADHKLAVIYTCKVCSTRSGKMIGKQA